MVDLIEDKRFKMKIALYQIDIQWESKEINYLRVKDKLIEPQENKTELFLLPEMNFTSFSMNTEVTKESGLETISKMLNYAKKYHTAIGFG